MKRLIVALLFTLVWALPAAAGQLFEYTIRHPLHGNIGTYTNLVESTSGGVIVTSQLDVVVKILGLTAHREHSMRRERWREGRLIAFQARTEKNGECYELLGEASAEGFVIHTPRGVQIAPAHVRPSNPWSVDMLRTGPLLSTRDGALLEARVSEGPIETLVRAGRSEPVRRFDIKSDKQDTVWVDAQGVPVAFRTEDGGTPIDFILTRRVVDPGTQQASAEPADPAATIR